MSKHKPDPLKTLMGGPQGGGHPLLPPALGLLEAQASGIPPEANDGRNQTAHYRRHRENQEFLDGLLAEIQENTIRNRSRDAAASQKISLSDFFGGAPTPTPAPSALESLGTLPLLLLLHSLKSSSVEGG